MRFVLSRGSLLLLPLLPMLATPSRAQYVPAQVGLDRLPAEQAYQRELRTYLAGLTEVDLAVDLKKVVVAPGSSDSEDQYRMWLLTLNLPPVEAAALPAAAFTLRALESGKGILLPAPPHASQMLAWLTKWDYAGNPYFRSAALKRRAFVLAAVDVMLLDYLYDHNPQGSDRADFLGGNLIWLGYTYLHVKDALTPAARSAMEAGLKRLVLRLQSWGPRGAMTDMDLFAAVGLRYVADGLGDAQVTKIAETYARRLFTDPRFFHPAGYFVDVGCFDTSYNGISLYFATWAALASDWSFARDAVDKAHRLCAHLSLPEPTGGANGPSHMSSRTSADPPHDQWNFSQRPYAAAMATDEALHLAPLPTAEAMKGAAARVVQHVNAALEKPRPTKPQPWQESHWSNALNFAYEHYPKGHYARRLALERQKSPALKSLYERKENFQHTFAEAFTISRFDDYAAVVHTGPIKGWPNGLGGGQLSAFWTPAAGPVVLGRRRGMQGPTADKLDEWRSWPVHAVSGVSAGDELFSSAFLTQPKVTTQLRQNLADVRVEGALAIGKQEAALRYQRAFLAQPQGVTVRTALRAKEPLEIKELYETLPLFLHDAPQAQDARVTVQFQVDGQWHAGTPRPQANVKTIRIERFQGALLVTLDRPRTVQLAPGQWKDGYQTQATCQTVLIHLLAGAGQQRMDAASVEYTLAAAVRPTPKKP